MTAPVSRQLFGLEQYNMAESETGGLFDYTV